MNKIKTIISNNRIYRTAIILTKRIVLPGFNGLPLYNVISFFIQKVQNSELSIRASALSFSFFLALFPGVIFIFTLIPYIQVEGIDFQKELLNLLKELMPVDAYDTTEETLNDIISQPRGGLLSFGFLLALFLSTNGINTMIDTFNMTLNTKETRSYFKQRMIALGLNSVLAVLMFVGIVLIVVGQLLLDKYGDIIFQFDTLTFYAIIITRWLIIVALILFSISILFHFGPAVQRKLRFISAGSSLATILLITTSVIFAYYINNFGQYNKLYGSIGTLIVIMLWIYINSLILLIGFELNASIFKGDE